MRVFLASIVAMIVLAGAAIYLLDAFVQRPADLAFSSPTNVRTPDHGNIHNLVGKDWDSAKEHGWGGSNIPTSNASGQLTD
jgi:hypothetical protein